MMYQIFKLLLLVMPVIGHPVGTEETPFFVDNNQMKFLATAQCESLYAHLCPSGLCSVESALNATTERKDDWTPAQFFCNADCMGNDGCRKICICAEKRLGKINPFPENSGEQMLSNPVLHCREPSFMSVKWDYSGNVTKDEPIVFAIEIQDYGDQWKPYTLTRKNITLIEGLIPRQKYRFRLFAVTASGVIESPTVSDWISTLPPVSEFESKSILLDPPSILQLISPIIYNSDSASVRLGWKPGNDSTCTYEMMWYISKPKDGIIETSGSYQISVTDRLMEEELTGLYLDQTYLFKMRSKLNYASVESNATTEMAALVVKDCLTAFNYDLTICRPPAPAKVNLRVDRTSNNTARVSISWTSVKGHPTGYNISLYDHIMRLIDTALVPEADTLATFDNVPLETAYHAIVQAYSPSGLGGKAVKMKKVRFSDGVKISVPQVPGLPPTGPVTTTDDSSDSLSENDIKPILYVERAETYNLFWVLLSTGVGGTVFVVCCTIITIRRRLFKRCLRKIPKIPEISQGCAMVRSEANSGPEPEPELTLCEPIGEGAFGTVWLGLISGEIEGPVQVAVKMLKEDPSGEDVRNFDNEMSILRSANRHPNVIRLIACLTQTPEKKIVMEYCKFGDLQKFLNKAWRELIKEPSEHLDHSDHSCGTSLSTFELHTYHNSQALANNTYGIVLDVDREEFSGELVSFARQIASGMEFLTESGILHRDLAARNILIAEDRTIRISDFGLSREVFDTSVYTKRGYERVPYKWVAPEAAKNKVFTTKSDVWSYGITLWEIVTLGSAPYSFITDVPSYLQYVLRGERMPQPCNCSSDLYEWMLRCWNREPEGRPSFQLLREHLENLERSRELHISLETDKIRSFSSMRPSHLERNLDKDETENNGVA